MSFVGTYKYSAKFRLPYRPDERMVVTEVAAEISNYFYRYPRRDFMCSSTDLARRCIDDMIRLRLTVIVLPSEEGDNGSKSRM